MQWFRNRYLATQSSFACRTGKPHLHTIVAIYFLLESGTFEAADIYFFSFHSIIINRKISGMFYQKMHDCVKEVIKVFHRVFSPPKVLVPPFILISLQVTHINSLCEVALKVPFAKKTTLMIGKSVFFIKWPFFHLHHSVARWSSRKKNSPSQQRPDSALLRHANYILTLKQQIWWPANFVYCSDRFWLYTLQYECSLSPACFESLMFFQTHIHLMQTDIPETTQRIQQWHHWKKKKTQNTYNNTQVEHFFFFLSFSLSHCFRQTNTRTHAEVIIW